ncbi:hypothetical protein SAMN05428954_2731 [Streptomyces sp. 2112.3]|uniref:hypothetical protein n=1 Tax=Streptomyces sp. 2112.3 TaxID=1881023 RepID=UPI00089458D0|nr:hypothetical protein [Streptomyces sp. 2112.3]SEE47428.1 hypothetical protein SAMN05428954_2731 [Streptomyces sp. 2112.3]
MRGTKVGTEVGTKVGTEAGTGGAARTVLFRPLPSRPSLSRTFRPVRPARR